MEAEVRRLNLSAAALKALDPQQRYVFALVGHVFNELLVLQKWVHISRRPPGSPGPQEDASVGVTMFLLRLLSAKVYEAIDVLKKQSVSAVLKAGYFDAALSTQWDEVVDRYTKLTWLGRIRNQGGFHYMNANQWTPALQDSICEDAYVYVGKRYADTYFHWAEMTAALPAMLQVNEAEPFEGLSQMVNELGELLGDITDCLARGLKAFMANSGVGDTVSDPIRFEAPALDPPGLHYFFADAVFDGYSIRAP